MDNRNTVTINGKTVPINDYVNRQIGKEIDRELKDSFNSGKGHPLINFIPVRGTTMEKKNQPSIIYRFIKHLLMNNGKEFTNSEMAKALGYKAANRTSYSASRFKDFVINSGDADGVFRINQEGRSVMFSCIAHSIDNPEQWAQKFYIKFKEYERVHESIKREEKKSGKRISRNYDIAKRNAKKDLVKKPEEEVSVVPSILNPIPQANGNPVDIPIHISITVSVDLKKD